MSNRQEEVFESEDFKEIEDVKTEESDEQPTQSSNDVIEERIKPSKAFQIYAGQLFDPESSVQNNNTKTVKASRIYDTTRASDFNFESPLQTYKRLQFEMQEFKQKLEQIAQKVCLCMSAVVDR